MVLGIFRGHWIVYLTIILAIIVGWFGHGIYLDMKGNNLQESQNFLESVQSLWLVSAAELISPQDHIAEDAIRVYDDRVVLLIDNPLWSSFTDTNSMDPLLDVGANGIEIIPENEEDIHLGDVISYQNEEGNIVIHRVIEIGADNEGIYYIVKGDNNSIADQEKVRFENIQGILVAVVY